MHLASPTDKSSNQATLLRLKWFSSIGADTYKIQASTDSTFNSVFTENKSGLTDTSDSVTAPLFKNMLYYWRVNATNSASTSAWSDIWTFTTIPPSPSKVLTLFPVNAATIATDSVMFLWSKASPNVDHYWVEYASDSIFTTPTIDSAVTDTTKFVRNLQNSGAYWFRVKAHNAVGWGDWSIKISFTVKLITNIARPLAIPKTFSFAITGRMGAIRYALPKTEHVSLRLYSLNGKLQLEPVNMEQGAGYYSLNMQRGALAAGSYLVIFSAGDFNRQKMVFIMK